MFSAWARKGSKRSSREDKTASRILWSKIKVKVNFKLVLFPKKKKKKKKAIKEPGSVIPTVSNFSRTSPIIWVAWLVVCELTGCFTSS